MQTPSCNCLIGDALITTNRLRTEGYVMCRSLYSNEYHQKFNSSVLNCTSSL